MTTLLICNDCLHSVLSHAGAGCTVRRCSCINRKETVIEAAIAEAKSEFCYGTDQKAKRA